MIASVFTNWSILESGWQALYGTDLGRDLVTDLRPWRWFRVRLAGLLARDTTAATLIMRGAGTSTPRKWTPEQVGDQLEIWAATAKE